MCMTLCDLCKLSYDVASGSDIHFVTPCNKIDKALVVYRFSVNVMASNGVHNNVAYIMTK